MSHSDEGGRGGEGGGGSLPVDVTLTPGATGVTEIGCIEFLPLHWQAPVYVATAGEGLLCGLQRGVIWLISYCVVGHSL